MFVLHNAMASYSLVSSRGVWLSRTILELPLKDKVLLRELADRFDCEKTLRYITLSLEHSIKNSPLQHLNRSSDANNVEQARLAITELGNYHNWQLTGMGLDSAWWTAIANLRPTWQLALSKLFWKEGFQLVDREEDEARPRAPNGRAYPRIREVVMQQTRRTYAQIAADFNP
jgi:hypothetical protein